MAAPEAKSVWKSIGVLVTAGLLIYLAVRSNAPGSKTLRFDVTCERFPVLGELLFDLYQHVTELDSIVAYDFGGIVKDVTTLSVAEDKSGKRKEKPRHIAALTLAPTVDANEPNSYLSLTRSGAVGKLSLIVRGPAALTGTTTASSGRPWMTVESGRAGDTTLKIDTARLVINEANRYRFPEIGLNQPVPGFAATIEGGSLLKLELESKGKPRTYVSLIFRKSGEPLPLWRGAQRLPDNLQLTFRRAMNPTLLIGDHRVEGIAADQRVDITAAYSTATVDDISVVYDSERRLLPALRIAGSAVVSSLRVEGRERMTTRLEEILNQPVASRTGSLLLLGALAALMLKIMDHAISVILEKLIPKG